MTTTLYVGTKKGFIRFRRENGAGWRLDGRSLEGLDVARLLLQPEQGRLWAATHGRGVLVSHDGGDTWDAVSPPEMAKAHAIYAQPGAPDVLYAGTEPAAIWKSEDAGAHWKRLGDLMACEGASKWFYPLPTVGAHIRSVAVNPRDPRLVFGAVQVGGTVRSTDGGATWRDYRNLDLDVHTVRLHPDNPRIVYAATGHDGMFRSEDDGETWTHISEGCHTFAHDVAFHPADPALMYYAAGIGEPPVSVNHPEGARAQIYRSTDGGDPWTPQDVGNPGGARLMLYEFAFNPENSDEMWLVGGNEVSRVFEGPGKMSDGIHGSLDDGALYQSTDGGRSWQTVYEGIPSARAVMVAP